MKDDFKKYLQSKDLATSTQGAYCFSVYKFLQWYNQDALNCTKKDVLKYLEHLKNDRQQENLTRRSYLIAINHYFTFLQQSGAIEHNPTALIKIRGTKKRTLYKTYTPEELTQFFDNYYLLFVQNFEERCYASKLGGIPANQRIQTLLSLQRNHVILGMLVYQGLATNELQKITLSDIDLTKASVRITGGKKSNERTLPLHASQIGFLINYIENIRPKIAERHTAENNSLFLPLPECCKRKTSTQTLKHVLKPFTQQLKSLDKKLVNLNHIRASVITHWLKTYGLRKAQYLAGHRYISSTEKYLPNQIEGLIEDITKYNPF